MYQLVIYNVEHVPEDDQKEVLRELRILDPFQILKPCKVLDVMLTKRQFRALKRAWATGTAVETIHVQDLVNVDFKH